MLKRTWGCHLVLVTCLAIALFFSPSTSFGVTVKLSPNHDAWVTGPGTTVDLPDFPTGFFGDQSGTPSDPVPAMPAFPLTSYPFIDQFGFPSPFPPDQVNFEMEFVDPHGNVVGPDSMHAVGINVENPDSAVPFNFDTVVRRVGEATFTDPLDTQDIPIQITWLSLTSVAPITVTYDTEPDKTFDVYVGLSDRAPEQTTGRIRLTANNVTSGGGGNTADGDADLGETGDQVDQEINNASLTDEFLAYSEFQQAFDSNPNALGLPVLFQLRFVNILDSGDIVTFDDPTGVDTGIPGLRTTSVFHNTTGTFQVTNVIPEPGSGLLLVLGIAALRARRRCGTGRGGRS